MGKNPREYFIGNPAKFFVSGNEDKEFVYEMGSKPFHIICIEQGHIPFSYMVLADSEKDAKQIFIDMCNFRIDCAKTYLKAKHTQCDHMEEDAINTFKDYIKKINSGFIYVKEIKKGLFFKTAWASNSEIH